MIDDSQLVTTLLEEGLADQAMLDDGLQQSQRSGKSLYETLIAAQLVQEPDLVDVMARLLDVPSSAIDPDEISADVSALVPGSMAHRHRVLPLGRADDGALVLGMANPADHLVIDELAAHTGVKIRPVLVGPGALEAALRELYPSSDGSQEVANAVLDAFDDFEVGEYLDEVMPGEEWSDFFDEAAQAGVEDSAVLSRGMQDRPSTDVLAAEEVDEAVAEVDEEDLPEIEIVEELGQPIRRRPPSPYASLDEWEVDEAIGGSSEIVSAHNAEDLFMPGEHPSAAVDEVEEVEEVDETSNLAELSESHTDALETASRTSVGVGVDHLRQGDDEFAGASRPQKKKRITLERTGKTQLGLPAEAESVASEAEAEEESDEVDKKVAQSAPENETAAERAIRENTDYGALGRAILKSGPTGKKAKREAPDADTDIAQSKQDNRPTDPRPLPGDEGEEDGPKSNTNVVVALFEDDDEEFSDKPDAKQRTHAHSIAARSSAANSNGEDEDLDEVEIEPLVEEAETGVVADAGTRPRLNTPAVSLPHGIDTDGLALALANLLIQKGILTLDEVYELARHFSGHS